MREIHVYLRDEEDAWLDGLTLETGSEKALFLTDLLRVRMKLEAPTTYSLASLLEVIEAREAELEELKAAFMDRAIENERRLAGLRAQSDGKAEGVG